VGKCSTPTDEGGTCGASIFANEDNEYAYCLTCQQAYDPLASLQDRNDTLSGITATVVELLADWHAWSPNQMSRATLYRRLAEGNVQPVGKNADGHALYSVLAVARAATQSVKGMVA
jgi:hypothetical protein